MKKKITKVYCDKCGREIFDTQNTNFIISMGEKDLCKECLVSIVNAYYEERKVPEGSIQKDSPMSLPRRPLGIMTYHD